MTCNIKLTVAYDGTNYLGWQKTKTGPSIEDSLLKALQQILQEEISLQAASRTDAGVHAEGQIVNFITNRTDITLDRLRYSLNCLLTSDISVLSAEQVPLDFHPTLDCTGKEYHYTICNTAVQLPPYRLYSWHVPYTLDYAAMQQASEMLTGTHNFESFCNFRKQSQYENYTRTVTRITLLRLPEGRLKIEVCGNNFLYKMVRNIVGTLIDVGRDKILVDAIPAILKSGDRKQSGVTAPAHGLSLFRVHYLPES